MRRAASTALLLSAPVLCEANEQIDELRKTYQFKKAVMASRTDWEARRLQQIFKEVEKEMALQKEMELRAQGERLQVASEARVEARRLELLLNLKAEAAKTRSEGLRQTRERLDAAEKKLAADLEMDVASKLAMMDAQRRDDLADLEVALEDRRKATDDANADACAALEARVEDCLSQVKAKASEHARQASAHRRTATLLHCAQALETVEPLVGAAVRDALSTTTTLTTTLTHPPPPPPPPTSRDVVATALEALPSEKLTVGVPEIRHLEARYRDRVEKPAKRWLLVPRDLDGLLGHGLAYLAELLGLSAPLLDGDASDVKAHLATLDAASRALEHDGDLKACVTTLRRLPTAHPATNQPSPALDWLHDAHARLAADQAAQIIRAKTSLLNAEQVTLASSHYHHHQKSK